MGSALVALGGALVAASLLGRFGRRMGLPTIPLFMLAGIVFGPYTPGLNLVHDTEQLEFLAAIGIVMLLFYLGLEFSLRELAAGGKRMFGTGAVYLVFNVTAALLFGFALGWGNREALVIAGALGISSSAIVTKLLVDFGRLANRESRIILGIIVVEDLFLALYLAVLQPILSGDEGLGNIVFSIATALGFLIVMTGIARYGAGVVGRFVDTPDDELLTVMFVGLAILVAGVAAELGVSEAIGAFMVGLVLAESPARPRIEKLVLPLRDVFAAVFFFSFGVIIDPGAIPDVAIPIAIAVAMTVIVAVVAGGIVARTYKFGSVAAANIAFTVLARGEFSLIVAALAITAQLDDRIGPLVAGYVLILAIGSPLLAANTKFLARLFPPRFIGRAASGRPGTRG